MSNTLLTIDMVTLEALRVLHGNLAFVKNVSRDYDSAFAKEGAKIGDTLRIRKPPQYTVRTGRVMNAQNATETYVSLPITNQKGVDLDFTSVEFTLKIDQFSKRFLKPAMAVLASTVDYDALSMTLDVYNSVGTPGTTPTSLTTWNDANAQLDNNLAPRDGERTAILTPTAMARTMAAQTALFQAGDLIADQYRSGVMSRAIDLKWAMDQNLRNVTMGTRDGTMLVSDAITIASGMTQIAIDYTAGTSAVATITDGEVFTIADVYQVNAETKQRLTNLQQFVVTATQTAVSSQFNSIPIAPTIYSTGALQNVNALPVNNAAVTFYGTTSSTVYPQNLVFHRDAFTFATADLKLPRNQEMASRKVVDGISMRIWEGADIVNDSFPTRSDVLYGYVATYPQLATRAWG